MADYFVVDEDQLEALESLAYPIKSSSFFHKGKLFHSEISSLKIYAENGLLTAQGKDKWGDFFISGNFHKNYANQVTLTKFYDDHKLDVNLHFQGAKLVGLWKTPEEKEFPTMNYVEVNFNLQEYSLIVSDLKGKKTQTKFFSNFLIDDNLSEYVGLTYKGKTPGFHDCSVYDTTHLVYSNALFTNQKDYMSGAFLFDRMCFDMRQTEVI
jgi:hypothetical protein